jgi:hypothetical protein
MNSGDMEIILGLLFSSYAFGWCAGFLFHTVKRAIEKIGF